MSDRPPPVGRFAGIPVVCTSFDEAVDTLVERARARENPQSHRLVNSYTMALASRNGDYHRLLKDRGINLPDGKPLVVTLNRLGILNRAFEQVRGPSFFVETMDRGRGVGLRHFFVGGTPAALASMINNAETRFPGLQVAGAISPPFRSLSDDERRLQDETVSASLAHVVWVGLGTPKQDFEAQRICDEVGIHTVAVGAAFDFLSGSKAEAPPFLRRMGLEWAFRLVTEPRRLWRRYLFGNARFLLLAARELVRRG